MAELMTTDVRALLDRTPFDATAVADLREVLGRDPSRYTTLREAVGNLRERQKATPSSETLLRMGVGEALLGHYSTSLEYLTEAGDIGMAHFHRGVAYQNLQRYYEAVSAFTAAIKAGYDPRLAELHKAGALRRLGKIDDAKVILDKLEGTSNGLAEYHYQRGSILAAEGDLIPAAAALEQAHQLDRAHTGVLFELAFINDLLGNDDTAVDLYSKCTKLPPVPLAAWVNLGVLYEDRMQFRDAESCYRQVLNYEKAHPRATLFYKDCLASRGMFIDESLEKQNDLIRRQMEIPVTDFELSVRSRNCLRKMNIRTLGDLTRTTEIALLASKNFGETSLAEIKEMMSSKNLRLGMALEAGLAGQGGGVAAVYHDPVEDLSPEDKAMLAKPIGDLNLSVRARKCLNKLSINTIGDLLSHTGDELLECKNFGVTSLNEVREKLTTLSLKLKNE
jgi:DNA-directed RNA polymerase subunit alpha